MYAHAHTAVHVDTPCCLHPFLNLPRPSLHPSPTRGPWPSTAEILIHLQALECSVWVLSLTSQHSVQLTYPLFWKHSSLSLDTTHSSSSFPASSFSTKPQGSDCLFLFFHSIFSLWAPDYQGEVALEICDTFGSVKVLWRRLPYQHLWVGAREAKQRAMSPRKCPLQCPILVPIEKRCRHIHPRRFGCVCRSVTPQPDLCAGSVISVTHPVAQPSHLHLPHRCVSPPGCPSSVPIVIWPIPSPDPNKASS